MDNKKVTGFVLPSTLKAYGERATAIRIAARISTVYEFVFLEMRSFRQFFIRLLTITKIANKGQELFNIFRQFLASFGNSFFDLRYFCFCNGLKKYLSIQFARKIYIMEVHATR